MKNRFTSFDIIAVIHEIQSKYLGYRVLNVYDIDNKTYLIRFSKTLVDEKVVFLLESGIRLHTTEFDWAKNNIPSGFSMKMRKHLNNKRLESVQQLGTDRIIDFQFGSGLYAFHVILELYDRGNIFLTDHEHIILYLLRPRTDKDQDVKFAVREKYPVHLSRQAYDLTHLQFNSSTLDINIISQLPLLTILYKALQSCKSGDVLRRILIPLYEFGPQVLEHCSKEIEIDTTSTSLPSSSLLQCKIGKDIEVNDFITPDNDNQSICDLWAKTWWFKKIVELFQRGQNFVEQLKQTDGFYGIVTYKMESLPSQVVDEKSTNEGGTVSYLEYHPFLFDQLSQKLYKEYPTFNKAVDDFYSQLESQKQDLQLLQQEKNAMKKLENVKKDHEKRIDELKQAQELDKFKGHLIELNLDLVDNAILIINHALANQVDWEEIGNLVAEAREDGSEVAKAIVKLKLNINHITMCIKDPYEEEGAPILLDIDIGVTAFANAKKYFDMKRTAASKEEKTVLASQKALKSAEVKTKQLLKDAHVVAKIKKIRKPMWFEKFYWFISSENYIVVGGRDQQQNEILVKRYFKPGDIYVHADLHGASSVIIVNHKTAETPDLPVIPPPKTLSEAGQMAVVYSSAWSERVVTASWWVHHDQVSKTAPSGEYLTTGSFMIRGRKNYLPTCLLQFGFGMLFKLEENSVFRHAGERKIRTDVLDDGDQIAPAQEDVVSESDTVANSESEDDKDNDEQQDVAFPDANVAVNLHKAILPHAISRSESAEVTVDQTTAGESAASLKPRISAKQRKQMKKQKDGDDEVKKQEVKKPTLKEKEKPLEKEEGEERDEEKSDNLSVISKSTTTGSTGQSQGPMKRGQRSRFKKQKEKYAEQDEEDRLLRLAVLQQGKEKKHKKSKGKNPSAESARASTATTKPGRPPGVPAAAADANFTKKPVETASATPFAPPPPSAVKVAANPPGEEELSSVAMPDEEEEVVNSEVYIPDTLTGLPDPEDELLYAVPVCAPYSTLNLYKYKVKLTPGNTKRGKAVKAAINVFLSDKTCTIREKELLKALKDQDISRNFPNKVKVSAPQINKIKNKK